MKPQFLLLTFCGSLGLLSPACAVTLLNDDFSDGNRSNQSLPNSAAWNSAHGVSTALSTNGGQQNLLSDAPSAGNNQVWATFGSTTLDIGDTINASFNFDVSGGSNGNATADGSLRIGLFNVGTPVTSDLNGTIANSSWNGATGYSAFVDVSPSFDTTATSTLRQRTGANDTLWAGGATSTLSTTLVGDGTIYTGLTNNLTTDPLRFLASLSITRTAADSISLTLTITGPGTSQTLTATDASGTATTFNTFSFFTGTTVAQDFAIDNVVVTVVPEPSGILAAALAPILLGLRRKR